MTNQLNHFESKLSFEIDSSDLFEAIERGEKIIPVDARKRAGFETEHIPGAINIPHREMNEATTALLDKNSVYAVYCDGVGCNASTKGAYHMTRLGFQVRELIGGIASWVSYEYATEGTNANPTGKKINCDC
jgi:rhodanese-related sulfurtransferase